MSHIDKDINKGSVLPSVGVEQTSQAMDTSRSNINWVVDIEIDREVAS